MSSLPKPAASRLRFKKPLTRQAYRLLYGRESDHLSDEAFSFLSFQYPTRNLTNVSLGEILNPGGRGGIPAPCQVIDQSPEVDDLRRLLKSGAAVMSFVEDLPEVSFYRLLEFSGQSDEHKEICSLAATWIDRVWELRGPSKYEAWYEGYCGTAVKEKLNKKWVSDEQAPGFCLYPAGGRADLITADEALYVECGFITTPRKVIDALKSNACIMVIPYPSTVMLNDLIGFLFSPVDLVKIKDVNEARESPDIFENDAAEGLL